MAEEKLQIVSPDRLVDQPGESRDGENPIELVIPADEAFGRGLRHCLRLVFAPPFRCRLFPGISWPRQPVSRGVLFAAHKNKRPTRRSIRPSRKRLAVRTSANVDHSVAARVFSPSSGTRS